jgi:hypothetical protein
MEDDMSLKDKTWEELHISLNVVAGISFSETMQLHVQIAAATIRILVNSGLTHSLILMTSAHQLGLQPLHQPGLQVTFANGDRVTSLGVCWAVHIFINQEFVLDLFVIPL